MEILIAVFLFGIIFSTIFVAYTGTFRIIGDTDFQADVYAMGRTAMERIMEDLASVYVPEEVSESAADAGIPFTGSTKEINGYSYASLRFLSTAHLDFEQNSTLPEPAEISYFVREAAGEKMLALYRSDTPMHEASPEEGTGGALLCDGLTDFKCTYYDADGSEQESWGAKNESSKKTIPAMVSIYLEFRNNANPEAPLKFRSAVALPLAGNKDESSS